MILLIISCSLLYSSRRKNWMKVRENEGKREWRKLYSYRWITEHFQKRKEEKEWNNQRTCRLFLKMMSFSYLVIKIFVTLSSLNSLSLLLFTLSSITGCIEVRGGRKLLVTKDDDRIKKEELERVRETACRRGWREEEGRMERKGLKTIY